MDEKNNIYTLFSRLEDIDIFRKDFSGTFNNTYNDFFSFDRGLVEGPPRKCGIDDERLITEDGRFFIDYKGAHFEAFFKYGSGTDKLIVSFGGARTANGGKFRKQLPFFGRWSWNTFIDGHFLFFEDPMYYQYETLRLGWFYGNEEEDYAVYAAEIIKKAADELHISDNDVILYASSGGGTAAIRAGAQIPGSQVVAINPQLDIRHFLTRSKHFMQTTGIDLEKYDKYHRNDMAFLIANAPPQANFLLIINAECRSDIEVQLKSYINGNNEHNPKFGLSEYGNVAVWIYDGPGENPHNVQEDYHIYPYIRYLLSDIKNTDFVNRHRYETLYINDWWRSLAQSKQENQILKDENQLLRAHIEKINAERLKKFSDSSAVFNEANAARIDIINRSGNNADTGTDIEWLEVSGTNVKLQAPLWFLKDGQGYVLQSDKCKINFKFKCVGNGNLEIFLRGICKRDKTGKNIPYWVDYTYFAVNGETIFSERKSVWHDKPYKFTLPVKNGDMIECTAVWEEHIE